MLALLDTSLDLLRPLRLLLVHPPFPGLSQLRSVCSMVNRFEVLGGLQTILIFILILLLPLELQLAEACVGAVES